MTSGIRSIWVGLLVTAWLLAQLGMQSHAWTHIVDAGPSSVVLTAGPVCPLAGDHEPCATPDSSQAHASCKLCLGYAACALALTAVLLGWLATRAPALQSSVILPCPQARWPAAYQSRGPPTASPA